MKGCIASIINNLHRYYQKIFTRNIRCYYSKSSTKYEIESKRVYIESKVDNLHRYYLLAIRELASIKRTFTTER
jgi:hypothetical protein